MHEPKYTWIEVGPPNLNLSFKERLVLSEPDFLDKFNFITSMGIDDICIVGSLSGGYDVIFTHWFNNYPKFRSFILNSLDSEKAITMIDNPTKTWRQLGWENNRNIMEKTVLFFHVKYFTKQVFKLIKHAIYMKNVFLQHKIPVEVFYYITTIYMDLKMDHEIL